MTQRAEKPREILTLPEQASERVLPSPNEKPVSKESVAEVIQPVPLPVKSVSEKSETVSPLFKDIEAVLEEGLSELYVSMPPVLQSEFKMKGEETLNKITQILALGRDMAKKVFEAIVEWLKLIPGVNKFFLEQEAKIKTDKILNIKEK